MSGNGCGRVSAIPVSWCVRVQWYRQHPPASNPWQLSILRLISEDARKAHRTIICSAVDVATYLINEKRERCERWKTRAMHNWCWCQSAHSDAGIFHRRVRDDERKLPENAQISYQIPAAPATVDPIAERERRPAEQPAVAALLPKTVAPVSAAPADTGARPASNTETPRRQFLGPRKALVCPRTQRRRGGVRPSTGRNRRAASHSRGGSGSGGARRDGARWARAPAGATPTRRRAPEISHAGMPARAFAAI